MEEKHFLSTDSNSWLYESVNVTEKQLNFTLDYIFHKICYPLPPLYLFRMVIGTCCFFTVLTFPFP